jgi:hypothetical protein
MSPIAGATQRSTNPESVYGDAEIATTERSTVEGGSRIEAVIAWDYLQIWRRIRFHGVRRVLSKKNAKMLSLWRHDGALCGHKLVQEAYPCGIQHSITRVLRPVILLSWLAVR